MSYCFIDIDRPCTNRCKAFNVKSKDCKLLENNTSLSKNIGRLVKWMTSPKTLPRA